MKKNLSTSINNMNVSNANINQKYLIIIATLLVLTGFVSGWLSFLMIGDIAGNCQVMFVSKDAIIKEEEKRIKKVLKEDPENETARILFFGKIDEAVTAMDKIANSYSNRKTKVLFISNNSGSVRNGTSISDQVHAEIINSLTKKREKE